MKILLAFVATLITLYNGYCSAGPGKTYYVDAKNGNNNFSGTTLQKAWKTLDKINNRSFEPGDKILLRRGFKYNGNLLLKGSGEAGQPITISAFGAGNRPVIEAGNNPYGILMLDEQYWEISDLEISGGVKAGIFIGMTKNNSSLEHFRIIGCYVHDVGNDSIYSWDFNTFTGGIVITNGYINNGKPHILENSSISDAIIDGCTVRYIRQWTCISISSGTGTKGRGNANFIRNCTTEYSAADGIRMNGVKNSRIEYSVMYKNGAWPKSPNYNWGGLGAWFFEADDCTIQYCEASYIDNWHNDGGAFDIDYYQTNSTIQYCYGHDCHGYGVSVFGADSSRPTVNSVIRHNVLRNNARDSAYAYQGDFYLFTWSGGLLDGVQVYDNISIWNPIVPAHSLKQDADYTGTRPNFFKNNIIYSDHPWLVYAKRNKDVDLDSNQYWLTGNHQPVWMSDSINYASLVEWQTATRQDPHSKFEKPDLHSKIIKNISHQTPGAGSKAHALSGDSKLNPKGKATLLSFIDLHSSAWIQKSQSTRAQIAFIKSMALQYGEIGLRVILIDGSWKKGKVLTNAAFDNAILDFELKNMNVIKDNKSKNLLKVYGVEELPTTFLINADGTIHQRWDSIALPAPLAFSIESILGESHLKK